MLAVVNSLLRQVTYQTEISAVIKIHGPTYNLPKVVYIMTLHFQTLFSNGLQHNQIPTDHKHITLLSDQEISNSFSGLEILCSI